MELGWGHVDMYAAKDLFAVSYGHSMLWNPVAQK